MIATSMKHCILFALSLLLLVACGLQLHRRCFLVGTVSWWDADEVKEGQIRDLRGTNHATLAGGAAVTTGKIGNAMRLSGDGDFAFASNRFPVSSSFTVAAWVNSDKTSQSESFQTIAAKWGIQESLALSSFAAFSASETSGLVTKGYTGAIFDGRYVYFAPRVQDGTAHGRVLRLDTQESFKDAPAWRAYEAGLTDGLATKGFVGGVFDGRYVYFAPHHDGSAFHGRVLRFDTRSELTDVGAWSAYDAGVTDGLATTGYHGALFDGRFVYFIPLGNFHGRVLRYDTRAAFDAGGSWTAYDAGLTDGLSTKGFTGGTFDGRYLYLAPFSDGSSHGRVLRFDTRAEFKSASSWNAFDAGAIDGLDTRARNGAIFDGRYVYFPATNGITLRYDTTGDFTNVTSWQARDHSSTDGLDTNAYVGGSFDGRYLYFIPFSPSSPHGRVLRFDVLGDFKTASSWKALDAGNVDGLATTNYAGAAFDGRYVYFVPHTNASASHANVLRYDTTGSKANFRFGYSTVGHQGSLGGTLGGIELVINTTKGPVGARYSADLSSGWHHVAGVYDGAHVKLYVDGVLAAEREASGEILPSATGVTLGTLSSIGGGFRGLVDEVQLYRVALTEAEVASMVQSGTLAACK